ncbi:hypothetical protein CTEN210_13703 [Chaetoceros tenuissimus]|uniref:Leucine-rich repeat domain-containing protein n=1 Tax=Chaetoceros tenuissimus TaxID=426638 RepID=A0AAD3HB04_9STRA|nr:hypothetical protein CTEN210_13703 [Chaetoceros tenuissimus]
MRIAAEEWQRFIPGIRMYKGKKTLFYNGENLYNKEIDEWLIYHQDERESWDVIIVLPGVEVIPASALCLTFHVETVIMADTVRRIEHHAFYGCMGLTFVRLSRNLEFIGYKAFCKCRLLTSIFVPPSSREIDLKALASCEKLIIFHVPRHIQLGRGGVISGTALMEASPFEMYDERDEENMDNEITDWIKNINNDARDEENMDNEITDWIKNINNEEQYALHRACSSFNPLEDIIYGLLQREGSLEVFKRKNSIGITPSQYLEANPYAEVREQKIINRFILEMIGEIVL